MQRSFRFVDMPHASGLSRQDTLPAEDPLWSYPPVPGIPGRNEPLLFIPNHAAAAQDDTLKNLSQSCTVCDLCKCFQLINQL